MLKQHFRSTYNMVPKDTRQKVGSCNYPMVAEVALSNARNLPKNVARPRRRASVNTRGGARLTTASIPTSRGAP